MESNKTIGQILVEDAERLNQVSTPNQPPDASIIDEVRKAVSTSLGVNSSMTDEELLDMLAPYFDIKAKIEGKESLTDEEKKTLLHHELNDVSSIDRTPQPIKGVTYDLKPDEARKMLESIKNRICDFSEAPPPPTYLLEQNHIPCFPTENLQMILAPRKSGKSTFGVLLISGILGCAKDCGIYAIKHKFENKVLHIDTEQATYDQYMMYKYVRDRCISKGMSEAELNRRYILYHGKGATPQELQTETEMQIALFKPTFVFVDGIKEYDEDINDNRECSKLIRDFEAICEKYHCAICFAIHANKMKRGEMNEDEIEKNAVARGALGTESENKCSDCFLPIKVGKVGETYYKVVHYASRHEEWQPILFERDSKQDGKPVPYFPKASINAKDIPKEVILNALRKVLNDGVVMNKGDLEKALASEVGKGERWIQSRWEEYKQDFEAILDITPQGRTNWIKLKAPDNTVQTELPYPDAEPPTASNIEALQPAKEEPPPADKPFEECTEGEAPF